MRGQRASILTAFAALLAFAGCNNQQPATAAPGAVSGGAPVPAVKPSDPPAPNLTILHRKGTHKGEAHQLVHLGTTVEWEYDKPGYYVNFVGTSPCAAQSYPLNPTSGTTEPYTASCTITANTPGASFYYAITNKASTKPADSKGKTGTHCEGCSLDE